MSKASPRAGSMTWCRPLGMNGISKSQVSRICKDLDEEVERFRTRRLDGPYPYVWLDATFLKVRQEGRVVSMAVVIAIGVRSSGEREVLGLDVGPSEDGAFWLQFLRSLVARGLTEVKLVVSDAHEGLKGAIAAVLYFSAESIAKLNQEVRKEEAGPALLAAAS